MDWTASDTTVNNGVAAQLTSNAGGIDINVSAADGETGWTLVGANVDGLGENLTGSKNSDTINGLAGNDTMSGGSGSDTFRVDIGADTIIEVSDNDVIVVDSGATLANATVRNWTATNATINNGVTAQITSHPSGGGVINLSNSLGVTGWALVGASLAENLTGSAQNDTISGLAGNDTINGGAGSDALNGGTGSNVFVYTTVTDSNADTSFDMITNITFNGATSDRIDINDIGTLITTESISGVADLAAANTVAELNSLFNILNGTASTRFTGGGNTTAPLTTNLDGSRQIVTDVDGSGDYTAADLMVALMTPTVTAFDANVFI